MASRGCTVLCCSCSPGAVLYGAGYLIAVVVCMLADVSVTLSPYPYHPPKLDLLGFYVDVPHNSTLRITCYGSYPMDWDIPAVTRDYSNVSETQDAMKHVARPYRSTLKVPEITSEDTGKYSCYYRGSKDKKNPGNVTSVYVFVNDPSDLFKPDNEVCFDIIAVSLGDSVTLPCRPTYSEANVTLWKQIGSSGYQIVPTGDNIVYDPTKGFLVSYADISLAPSLKCMATVNGSDFPDYPSGHCKKHTLEVSVSAAMFSISKPVITGTNGRGISLNGSFTLTCSARAQTGQFASIIWKYPVTEEARVINSAYSTYSTNGTYRFDVFSKDLSVTDVRPEDEGVYTCEAYDQNSMSRSSSVYITVYEESPKSYINFTNNINTGEPYVTTAGKEFKFTVPVIAYPEENLTLTWEKDGAPLQNDERFEVLREGDVAELAIKDVTCADKGVYTLRGRNTDDVQENLSVELRVSCDNQGSQGQEFPCITLWMIILGNWLRSATNSV